MQPTLSPEIVLFSTVPAIISQTIGDHQFPDVLISIALCEMQPALLFYQTKTNMRAWLKPAGNFGEDQVVIFADNKNCGSDAPIQPHPVTTVTSRQQARRWMLKDQLIAISKFLMSGDLPEGVYYSPIKAGKNK